MQKVQILILIMRKKLSILLFKSELLLPRNRILDTPCVSSIEIGCKIIVKKQIPIYNYLQMFGTYSVLRNIKSRPVGYEIV